MKNKKIITFVFFAFILLLGFSIIPKVSCDFDEEIEKMILLGNIKDYSELLGIDEVTNMISSQNIVSISESIEKDHGVAIFYILTPFVLMRSQIPHLMNTIWHVYIFIIFFVSAIYMFKLIKELYDNEKYKFFPYLITSLYVFSPRIFIDSMHNNKDIVMMSLLVVAFYYLVKLIKNDDYKDLIILSILCGFISNIKVIGLFFSAIIGFGYILYMLIQKKFTLNSFNKVLWAMIIIVFVFLIITPAIWGNGTFDIVGYVKYCLDNGVNFRNKIEVLFEGTRYIHPENPLPWYYLPKMMMITLPIIISVLFISSIIFINVDVISNLKKIKYFQIIVITALIIFFVPFLICVLKSPNIYNGWRHFYFLYGLILICCSYSLYKIKKIPKLNIVISAIVIITVLFNVISLIKNDVANASYYNVLAGTGDLSQKYELDYYNVTTYDAIQSFIDSDDSISNSDKIYLVGFDFNYRILTDFYAGASLYMKNRIVYVHEDSICDYLKDNRVLYSYSNPMYNKHDMSSFDLVYTYKMKNNKVVEFYKINEWMCK